MYSLISVPPPLPTCSIPALQTLLGAALGRVNLDLTFLDDSIEDTATGGCHDNTSSYLLLWLLLIEIMSHCGPEVWGGGGQACKLLDSFLSKLKLVTHYGTFLQARASLGEWLKEQSLFPHLLHGLFTLLSETSSSFKTQIEGVILLCSDDQGMHPNVVFYTCIFFMIHAAILELVALV